MAAMAGLAAGGLRAEALLTQEFTLSDGWNAVYVSVAPANTANEVFADWPVEWVAAYNADAFLRTASTAGGFTGEQVVRAPYWIWSRSADYANTVSAIAARLSANRE